MSLQLHTEKVIGTICASAVSAAVPAANARGTALPARRVQQLVTNYFVGPVHGPVGTVALHIIIMDTITKNSGFSYPIRTILSCSTAVTIAPSLDTSTE